MTIGVDIDQQARSQVVHRVAVAGVDACVTALERVHGSLEDLRDEVACRLYEVEACPEDAQSIYEDSLVRAFGAWVLDSLTWDGLDLPTRISMCKDMLGEEMVFVVSPEEETRVLAEVPELISYYDNEIGVLDDEVDDQVVGRRG